MRTSGCDTRNDRTVLVVSLYSNRETRAAPVVQVQAIVGRNDDNSASLRQHVWATVCKTVRPMLPDRCLSVLSVGNVGVLWPNGWTDQDETWRAGTPRTWHQCVRWGPSSPSPKGHSLNPIFGPCPLWPND